MEGNVRKVLSGVGFYGTLAVCPCHCGRLRLAAALWRRGTGWTDAGHAADPGFPAGGNAGKNGRAAGGDSEAGTGCAGSRFGTPAADPAPAAAEAPRLIVEPLRGEVLTAFSMEELVYNQTLGDWRTHDGVDIAADSGRRSAGGLRRDGTGRDGGSPAGNHCGAGP